MSKTIICSVGTSAAKGICPVPQLGRWVTDQGGIEAATPLMLQHFADIRPEGEALRTTLSAEIHSLARIGVSAADRVILLASDTDDGEACAAAVAGYLDRHYPDVVTDVRRVAGLQVHDAERFRKVGVVNYVRHCLKAVNDFGADHVILNPTGGFKALVPYTVLVGMLKRARCQYIFEQSEALLELPPLPVEFQRGLFEAYRGLFETFERESSISREQWERAVHYQDRATLEPLVEFVVGDVTPSAVGLLFLDEVRTPSQLVPFLSRRAWDDCLSLAKRKECEPFQFLDRVARSPEARRLAEHKKVGGGLVWLKPGNTVDRYLVSEEGWRLLVWRAVGKDELGDDYISKVSVDPARERSRYAPFTRMERHE